MAKADARFHVHVIDDPNLPLIPIELLTMVCKMLVDETMAYIQTPEGKEEFRKAKDRVARRRRYREKKAAH